MNLLIIGGSGFVSGTLAIMARRAGHKIDIVTRGQKKIPAGVNSIVADRKNWKQFKAGLAEAYEANGQPWDLVVDCIGYDVEDAKQDIDVFPAMAKHLVFVSTDFVYDPDKRTFPQSEDNPHYLTDTSYGARKRRCEQQFITGGTGNMLWTIVRPCHIYGPGSRLGCLPDHGRDPELINRLRAGDPLHLVGGGLFMQQPILAADLAQLILSIPGKTQTWRQIYHAAGPDIIESHRYYAIIAEALGVDLRVLKLPVAGYLAEHPDSAPFLCHRVYSMAKAREHGLAVPSTPIEEGLKLHLAALTRGKE